MIETTHTFIRPIKIFDAKELYENIYAKVEVVRYLSFDAHKNIEETKEYIQNNLSNNQATFVIIDKETKELIGLIGKVYESLDYHFCEICYLLDPKYQNKKIMTEVLSMYFKHLFYKEDYSFVSATIHLENGPSLKVAQKCGMHYANNVNVMSKSKGLMKCARYILSKEDYQISKMIATFNEKLGQEFPLFTKENDFLEYLKSMGYPMISITTFDNDRVFPVNKEDIALVISKKQNISTYTYISKPTDIALLKNVQREFFNQNKESIISTQGKSLEQTLQKILEEKKMKISFAESCTGGSLAATLIKASGASKVLEESFITYSEEAKKKILGVKQETLDKYTVYSKEVAKEMAWGLFYRTGANIMVSVTGLAGGSTINSRDGNYDYCILVKSKDEIKEIIEHKKETGDRNTVRIKQVNQILFHVLKVLRELS